jgi:CheY-like chemotaxis protein
MRVLVVEDDPQPAGPSRRGLADDNFVVDAAGNGPEALSRAPELEYDAPCRPEKNRSQMSKKRGVRSVRS